ncbi:hypothetical protein [Treponema sp. R6D11]
MDWFTFIICWDAIYKRFQGRYLEELEIYETSLELDNIETDLDEIGALLDAAGL